MKYDVILAGVGGQGVLSVTAIIALSAMRDGFQVKQSEVHGMAQRGGAVRSNLRIGDGAVHSDLIAEGTGDLIISMEPLESLRYLRFLSPEGMVLTAAEPVQNFGNYPDLDEMRKAIADLPNAVVIEAERLARDAGGLKSVNAVMVGAASFYIPVKQKTILASLDDMFGHKGEKVVEINREAFRLGRSLVESMAAGSCADG